MSAPGVPPRPAILERVRLLLHARPFLEWGWKFLLPTLVVSGVVGTIAGNTAGRSAARQVHHGPVHVAANGEPLPTASEVDDPAEIEVTSTPDSARVTVDGRIMGNTPIERIDVDPGTHAVVVELPNYEPYLHSVRVKGGTIAKVRATLIHKVPPPPVIAGAPPAPPVAAAATRAKPEPTYTRAREPEPPHRNCDGDRSNCRDHCYSAGTTCDFSCPYCSSCMSNMTQEQCTSQCQSCRQGCAQNKQFCESSCESQYEICRQ